MYFGNIGGYLFGVLKNEMIELLDQKRPRSSRGIGKHAIGLMDVPTAVLFGFLYGAARQEKINYRLKFLLCRIVCHRKKCASRPPLKKSR